LSLGRTGDWVDFNFLTFQKEDKSNLLRALVDEYDEYSQINMSETRKLPLPPQDFTPKGSMKFLYYDHNDTIRIQYYPQYHSKESIEKFVGKVLKQIDECYSELDYQSKL
jgi:hypothetical protein